MRYLLLTVFFVLIAACDGKMENKKDEKTDKIDNKTDKTDYKQTQYALKPYQVVLPSESKMDWLFGKNYKAWTPSDNDIEAAEKILYTGYGDQKRGTVNRLLYRNLEDYNRQFVGAIDENGDKIIWINCFCKKEEGSFKKWKEEIVHVADGGNCFFNLKANITKNTYTDFIVNGDA